MEALTPQILCMAYSQGYFPMPDSESGEILWFHPDPRAIIPLDGFHASRSLARKIRRGVFEVSYNEAFREVMQGCADRPETWINDFFIESYTELHELGLAHSVEVWQKGILVGGTYGVCLGGAFFAESMFHKASDASKAALFFLVERLKARRFLLLECQFLTEHLASLGACEIPAKEYRRCLASALKCDVSFNSIP